MATSRHAVALMLVAAAAPAAASPGSGELRRWCSAFAEEQRGDDATLCRAYVEGYLGGARMGERMAAQPPSPAGDEGLVERATRTRLTQLQLQRARGVPPEPYCLDDDVKTIDVVARIAPALAQPLEPALAADEAVHRALVRHFPCHR